MSLAPWANFSLGWPYVFAYQGQSSDARAAQSTCKNYKELADQSSIHCEHLESSRCRHTHTSPDDSLPNLAKILVRSVEIIEVTLDFAPAHIN